MTHKFNLFNPLLTVCNLFLLDFSNLHLKYSIKNNKMSQISTDCLYEIFEYLDYYGPYLRSCLLVNRLWCEVSVRILWRSYLNHRLLIACLPNESKEILYENGIIISPPTSKPPMFNYVSFCKDLTFSNVESNIRRLLNNNTQHIKDNLHTVMQEI